MSILDGLGGHLGLSGASWRPNKSAERSRRQIRFFFLLVAVVIVVVVKEEEDEAERGTARQRKATADFSIVSVMAHRKGSGKDRSLPP